ELRIVTSTAPLRVVAVLLATPGVPAGRLDVAVRVGADPDVGPGGRDGERLDPLDGRRVPDGLAVPVAVRESAPRTPASDPRPVVAGIAQARAAGLLRGVVGRHPAERGMPPIALGVVRRASGITAASHGPR